MFLKIIESNQRIHSFLLGILVLFPVGISFGEDASMEKEILRIRRIVHSRGENPTAVAHLVQLSKDLDKAVGAKLFRSLADDYLQTGMYDQAGRVLQELVLQYAEQPIAQDGLLTLMQLYSSSEVIHCRQKLSKIGDVKSSAASALKFARQKLLQQPGWSENAAINFQCSVSARLSGVSGQGWLTSLKHNTRSQPWNHRAKTEDWLVEQSANNSPKQLITCGTTGVRPHLDGVLDELMWQSTGNAVIAPTENNQSISYAKIQLLRDDDFLYMAIRCRKSSDHQYLIDNTPRSHDADLSKHDHVHIQLDVDRDYSSAFQLSVDQRGQTADRCWLDRSWNPQWYVASQHDDTHWTIEAAIAWEELTAQPPQAGEAWALSLKRLLPVSESQSWAGGTETIKDHFGLVIFE